MRLPWHRKRAIAPLKKLVELYPKKEDYKVALEQGKGEVEESERTSSMAI